jgi:hypothetical protein
MGHEGLCDLNPFSECLAYLTIIYNTINGAKAVFHLIFLLSAVLKPGFDLHLGLDAAKIIINGI